MSKTINKRLKQPTGTVEGNPNHQVN